VKQIIDIFILSNFLIGFTELQNSCTQLKYTRIQKKRKKIINITYFWHVELSSDTIFA